ncbi:MAG TPA: PKD domain-containing protein [Thermoanaerobaculia bacterium]|nr:PKD domain-containing protein [Thermoanaerobaculia bacterium]
MKSRSPLALLALLALFAVAIGLACGKASPTAPSGTLLTISASPTRISSNGTATISIIGRTATGTPLRSGTELRLATSLGSIEPLVTTNSNGEATATLRGDGRQGTATVEVTTGVADTPPMTSTSEPVGNASGTGSATVTVQIGSNVGGVSLQATPSTISLTGFPAGGKRIDLLALVRDDQGNPLPDSNVNFTSEIGVLDSRGRFLTTNSRGEASDRLTVQLGELTTFQATTFAVKVRASLGSGTQEATFDVRIQRETPVASFIEHSNGGNRVRFENTTTGAEPISYQWDFTNDGTIDSSEKNPTHDYGSPGSQTVRLVATNSAGTDTEVRTITVPVQ